MPTYYTHEVVMVEVLMIGFSIELLFIIGASLSEPHTDR